MSTLSSILTRTLASAVVTTAALSGSAIAAGCGGGACTPKRTAAKSGGCGAKGCGAKCGACGAKAAKAKAKCGAKCGACKAGSGAACAAKK